MHFCIFMAAMVWGADPSRPAQTTEPASPKSGKSLTSSTLAANDRGFEHLTYGIPKNALRTGPFGLRTSGPHTMIKYYYLYSDPKTGDRVGRETFVEDRAKKGSQTRVRMELFKDQLVHGVQREWHDNGKPKSVAPYKKWIMHGTFKHWDKNGKLIGWYRIINGKGVRRLYYSNGQLHRELAYDFNRTHGPIRIFHENGQLSGITQHQYNEPYGMGVSFWPNGEFEGRSWSDSEGHLQLLVSNEPGPNFMGPLRLKVTYYLRGSKVSQKQYLAAATKDPSLPIPLDDPEKYKELSERTKRIVDHYKKLRRVKIPLEAPTDNTLPFDIPEPRK